MSTFANELQKGHRFWYDGRPATLVGKDHSFEGMYSSHITYTFTLRFDDDKGGTRTLSEWSVPSDLYRSIVFTKDSGFELGDTLEIKRDGLEPNLRGKLLEINENAERYPYRVGQELGVSIWFSWHELTKIHSVVSYQRSPRAKEVLKKVIAEKREELEALETALEVLEYATT